jgi:hypothetical protein
MKDLPQKIPPVPANMFGGKSQIGVVFFKTAKSLKGASDRMTGLAFTPSSPARLNQLMQVGCIQ